MRTCGGCGHFAKQKNGNPGDGLCIFKNISTSSDQGHDCLRYTPAPYDRARYRSEFHKAARAYLRGEAA